MTTAFTSTAATLITDSSGWAHRRQLATILRTASDMWSDLAGSESWNAEALQVWASICKPMVRVIDPANYSASDAHLIEIDRAIAADWQTLADIATARVAEIEAAIAVR
jgi:hypothetical protein